MLRVELYQSIRNAVNKEGMSIRATAKEFKVHRREVRRAFASAIRPERKSAPKVRPKLSAYESTVRARLTEDLKVPKKQRHSATRSWQRLVDEFGADVSVSAVRVMVRELKAEIIEPTARSRFTPNRECTKAGTVDWLRFSDHLYECFDGLGLAVAIHL
jgi:transposase